MTKVTVEQAIELLRQHDTLVQDKGREFYASIDNEQAESIADLIESLSREAELGRAIVSELSQLPCNGIISDDCEPDEGFESVCDNYWACRIRAEKEDDPQMRVKRKYE